MNTRNDGPSQQMIDDAIATAHKLRAEYVAKQCARLWKFITFQK